MQTSKKVLLATAILAASSAAFAQSSVSIYGRINTTVEWQKKGKHKTTGGLHDNSSRWGIRGSEDLGLGLKAGFQLESGFSSDTGESDSTYFARQSEVNLSSDYGMLRLGNFTAESYYATADVVSMHNHDTGSSADVFYSYVMRDTDKIAYRLPALGSFTLEGAVSLSEKVAGVKNAYDLALNYGTGPLGLGLGYSRNKSATGVFGGTAGDAQQIGLRASYALGLVALGAYYQYARVTDANGMDVDVKRHSYRLAAMYTLGSSEFHANFGRADKIKTSDQGKLGGTAANQWTLGYNYNLSRRTKVYGYYTRVDNGSNSGYGSGDLGADFRSFALGLRHNF